MPKWWQRVEANGAQTACGTDQWRRTHAPWPAPACFARPTPPNRVNFAPFKTLGIDCGLIHEEECRHRWFDERALAWINRFRRLTIRYEQRIDIHHAFTAVACPLICFNASSASTRFMECFEMRSKALTQAGLDTAL